LTVTDISGSLRAQGLEEGDVHPAYAVLWSMVNFTFTLPHIVVCVASAVGCTTVWLSRHRQHNGLRSPCLPLSAGRLERVRHDVEMTTVFRPFASHNSIWQCGWLRALLTGVKSSAVVSVDNAVCWVSFPAADPEIMTRGGKCGLRTFVRSQGQKQRRQQRSVLKFIKTQRFLTLLTALTTYDRFLGTSSLRRVENRKNWYQLLPLIKIKVKVNTLDIAPLHSESPP